MVAVIDISMVAAIDISMVAAIEFDSRVHYGSATCFAYYPIPVIPDFDN